ncbi:hypothetical protein [Xanthobacter sp. KR7-225]|uniref:hypothetical protein n=1 Tax=Xanthobacter sp. KR7-225 TaxID=3156613 RepID=UPI0032B45CD1
MSLAEFYAWLFKAATGWLGWPPAVALATPIPQIEAAFEGRMEMLKAIFGGGEGKATGGSASLGAKLKAAMSLRGTRKVKRKKKP